MLLSSLALSLFLLTLMGLSVGESLLLVHIDRARTLNANVDTLFFAAIADARAAVVNDIVQQAAGTISSHERVISLPLCVQSATTCGVNMHEYFDVGTVVSAIGTSESTSMLCDALNKDICNLEQAGNIAEGRVEITVRIVLSAANGAELASREKIVRFQILHRSPYALVVGVVDPQAASPVQGTGDIGGLPPDINGHGGTLIQSYDPCRSVPAQSPVGSSGEGLSWGNWQGSSYNHGVEAVCAPGAGSVSQFADGNQPAQVAPNSSWSN